MKPSELNAGIKQKKSDEILQTLSQEISQKYGISIQEAKDLLERKTNLSLNEFREEIEGQQGGKNINQHQIEELYAIIEGYKKILIEKSKLGIETLKTLLNKESLPFETTSHTWLKKHFPDLIKRIEDPKNLSDQITGGMVGIIESGFTLLTICYLIGKGIITSPYDLYLIATGKAVYEKWKRM